MNSDHAAHFDLVKVQNRRILRNLLRAEGSMSVARIAEKAGLSYPTASGLLKELVKIGEAMTSPETETCGGRPGVCYELNPAYQYAFVVHFNDWTLQGTVYDACGSPVQAFSMHADTDLEIKEVVAFIKSIKEEYPRLSAVSIGVPGAVYGTDIAYLPKFYRLQGDGLAKQLYEALDVKVFLENDINATAFAEVGEWEDFAHIVYMDADRCMGVGIIMQGEIVRGSHGYAGELECLCSDMTKPEEVFTTSILALTCVLNLPDILVSGGSLPKDGAERLQKRLQEILPKERIPRIHVVKDMEGKYEAGLLKRVLLEWSKDI